VSNDNDETAFPTRDWKPGMSLRDYFAAMALQGMLGNPSYNGTYRDAADDAYNYAYAMLAARKNKA
jgi:hypothetical protein